jgi:alpha-beta hydrolase superfamily lysophospholipase
VTTSRIDQTLDALDGRPIPVHIWKPESGEPRCIVQVLHGLSEHAARYGRFGQAASEAGIAVVAHDHRGHGSQAKRLGHFADDEGWRKVLGDVGRVQEFIRENHPGTPIVLLGHSMGSFIAQASVIRSDSNLAGLILSGSSFGSRLRIRLARLVAALEIWRHGVWAPSELMNKLNFQAFNKPFEPARTEFDWLSGDDEEVDRYIADPLCGAIASGGLWRDLTGGLLEIMSVNALRRIPATLPILITGGARDPVGGLPGMTRLYKAYEASGHRNVTLKIYPDARHEILNETNRKAVTRDLLAWIEGRIR